MNMTEFTQIRNMTYLEYCDYLQGKYGIGLADYMTKSYNPNPKCKRTKDGLIAHHKMENYAAELSMKEMAQVCPFEWQSKENIVYCDYLEHLWLHILICKSVYEEKGSKSGLGISGVLDFIAPELNDLYSGWITGQAWRKNCHDKVINDKDVYLAMLEDFIKFEQRTNYGYNSDSALAKAFGSKYANPKFRVEDLFTSYNEQYGLWSKSKNTVIYAEIASLA